MKYKIAAVSCGFVPLIIFVALIFTASHRKKSEKLDKNTVVVTTTSRPFKATIVTSTLRPNNDQVPTTEIYTARPRTEKFEVCLSSQACHDRSRSISLNLNTSVDPCEDFYDFACGRYGEVYPLQKGETSRSALSDIHETVSTRVNELINSIDENREKIPPIRFAKIFLNQCMDDSLINDINALKELVKGYGNWSDQKSRSVDDNLIEVLSLGVKALFTITVEPDPRDNSNQVWSIDPPSFGFKSSVLKRGNKRIREIIKDYENFINETAELLGRKFTYRQIDEIVSFETELAKVSSEWEKKRIRLKNLKQEMKDFDIEKVLIELLVRMGVEKDVMPHTTIITENIGYLREIGPIIQKTSPNIINNYLGWRILWSFRKKQIKLSDADQEGWKKDRCIGHIKEALPLVVGRLYVDKYFSDKDKKSAKRIVTQVLSTYKDTIPSYDWLDEESKESAVIHVASMRLLIGFLRWIKDDNQLIKEYPLEVKETVFENWISLRRTRVKHMLEELDMPANWVKRRLNPTEVNAFFHTTQSSLTFPAAILQGVFFDPKLPDYLNLGSFGAVVGHEITHGLSMTYRDERGRLHNKWRTQGADKNYTERATCLKNQYGSIVDKQTGLKLNGTLTLEDDIADNGGINVAFATWKRLETGKRANQQLLPGMKEWTRDQLFFIAYAQLWCSIDTKEEKRNEILTSDHSPNRYRINVPLQNSPEFSNAFKCKEGSKMNPMKRCVVF